MYLTAYYYVDILLLLLTIIYLLHTYMSRNFDYWEKRNIFYFKPSPFIGNFLNILLFKESIGGYLAKLYNQTREPIFGIFVFDQPYLILRSPQIIKYVLVKDFKYFDDRTILFSKHDLLCSHMLFISKNPAWKITRTKVTPMFTSGKIKMMMPHLNNIGQKAIQYIEKKASSNSVEAKDICARFTTDVIVKCAFATDARCFEDENAEFREIGRILFEFKWSNAFQQTSYFFLPTLAKIFRLKIFDSQCCNFIKNVFWDSLKIREKNKCKGNDFIDLMIEMKQNDSFECDDKIAAQALQMFLAGFETSSSTMGFMLYELCIHPYIQKKLHTEIKSVIQQYGEITYEAVQSMKYLHMCVCETLRKYPVLPFLDRRCKEDYKIPGTDIIIEKGMPVYIPMFGLHYDPEYFPNPQEYNPERFSPENISSIPSCSYIPFGEGPRNCIGERFGLLSTKIGLIHILSEFEVEKSLDTPVPLKFEPRSLILASKVGLPMKFKKLVTFTE